MQNSSSKIGPVRHAAGISLDSLVSDYLYKFYCFALERKEEGDWYDRNERCLGLSHAEHERMNCGDKRARLVEGGKLAIADSEPSVRRAAVAVGNLRVELLCESLMDSDALVRELAADKLGYLWRPKGIQLDRDPALIGLARILADPVEDVRWAAAHALRFRMPKNYERAEVLDKLCEAASDDSPKVRANAILALLKVNKEQAKLAVTAALRNEAPEYEPVRELLEDPPFDQGWWWE